jgi:hypothetical protein
MGHFTTRGEASVDYRFELNGTMPILMHMDDVMAADVLNEWRKSPSNKSISTPGDDRSPAWSWMTYLYHDSVHVAVPWELVMACLRGAGSKVPAKRGSFKSMTQSGLLVRSDYCEFTVNDKQIALADVEAFKDAKFSEHVAECRKLGFDLLIKRAKIGTSKHVRVRPIFRAWKIRGTIGVSEAAITRDVLEQLFEIAGRLIGLGDWRPSAPQSPGPYGMFQTVIDPISTKSRKAS